MMFAGVATDAGIAASAAGVSAIARKPLAEKLCIASRLAASAAETVDSCESCTWYASASTLLLAPSRLLALSPIVSW